MITVRSVIPFESVIVYGILWIWIAPCSSTICWTDFPHLPLCCLGTVGRVVAISVQLYFWAPVVLYWSLLMQCCLHLATVALEQIQHREGWLSARSPELAWCAVRPWDDPQPCKDKQINNKIRDCVLQLHSSFLLLVFYLFSVPAVELRTLLALGKCFASLF